MSMDKPYRVEVTVDAPRDVVWRALTEPEQIRHWFGWEYDGLDDEIEFIFVKHATLRPPDRIEMSQDGLIELERPARPHRDPRHQARRPRRRRMARRLRRHRGGLDHVLQPAPPPRRPPPGLEPPHDRPQRPSSPPPGRSRASPGTPAATSAAPTSTATLVVVFAKPDGGEAMLLVTTYDLDDDAFTAAEQRWDAWWAQLPR